MHGRIGRNTHRDDTHLILDGEVRVYRRERSKRRCRQLACPNRELQLKVLVSVVRFRPRAPLNLRKSNKISGHTLVDVRVFYPKFVLKVKECVTSV